MQVDPSVCRSVHPSVSQSVSLSVTNPARNLLSMKSIWPKSVCLSGCLLVSPSVVYLLVSHFVLNVSELIISIFFFDIPCIRRMYTSTVRNGTDCLMKETGNHSRSWQSYLCFYSFYDKFKEMWPLRQWRVASKQRTSIHYEHMKYIKRQM